MLARGHYEVKSKFIDDDKTTHKEWSWVSEQMGHRIIGDHRTGTHVFSQEQTTHLFFVYMYSLSTSRRTGKNAIEKSPGERADRQADRRTDRSANPIKHPTPRGVQIDRRGPLFFFI